MTTKKKAKQEAVELRSEGPERSDGEGITRIGTARFLGMKSVEGVRYLERTDKLHPEKDETGVHRFDPEELERVKAQRETGGRSPRLDGADLGAVRRGLTSARRAMVPEKPGWLGVFEKQAADDAFHSSVRAKNEATRADFLRDHVSAKAAAEMLGFGPGDWRLGIRRLVRAELLVPVVAPRERVVEDFFGMPLREVEGFPIFFESEQFFRRAAGRGASGRAAHDGEGRGRPRRLRGTHEADAARRAESSRRVGRGEPLKRIERGGALPATGGRPPRSPVPPEAGSARAPRRGARRAGRSARATIRAPTDRARRVRRRACDR